MIVFIKFFIFSFFFANICASYDLINALNLDKTRANKYQEIPMREDFSSPLKYQDALEKSLKYFEKLEKNIAENIGILNERIQENEPNIVNEKQKREEQKTQRKLVKAQKRKVQTYNQYKQKLIDYIHQKQEELFAETDNIDDLQPIINNTDDQNLIKEINEGFACIKTRGIKVIQKLNLDDNVRLVIRENDEIPEIITEQHKRKCDNELYEFIKTVILNNVFHYLSSSFRKLILFNINSYNQLITKQPDEFLLIEDFKTNLCIQVSWSSSLANFILLLPSAVGFYGTTGLQNYHNNNYSELENALYNGRNFYSPQQDSKRAIKLYYELYLEYGTGGLTNEAKDQKNKELKDLLENPTKDPYFKYLKKKLYPSLVGKTFKILSNTAYVAPYFCESNSDKKNKNQENKKISKIKKLDDQIKINTKELDLLLSGEKNTQKEKTNNGKSRKNLDNIKQYITFKNICILTVFVIFVQKSLSHLKKR